MAVNLIREFPPTTKQKRAIKSGWEKEKMSKLLIIFFPAVKN
jgi:hypothetical protein